MSNDFFFLNLVKNIINSVQRKQITNNFDTISILYYTIFRFTLMNNSLSGFASIVKLIIVLN